jgi:integrase
MADEERIAGTNHKKNYESAFRKLSEGQDGFIFPENREFTLTFLKDAELGRTIFKGQKKKIAEGRLVKMCGLLKKMDYEWFKKPFDKVNEQDMIEFITRLERGIITSNRRSPYTPETQSTIKKFIRKYYKYLMGEGINYPKMVQFIDTSTKIPEIRAISKNDVDKLIEFASKLEHKLALAFLFDSGARIAEFYNVKLSDISKENNTYKVRIRVSKTRPRTVNVPLYTDLIDMYLEKHPERKNPDAFFFLMTFSTLRKMLQRLGKRVLDKPITPHQLRHSSATYYSKFVSRYQLCYRYGWSASSKMPDRYIDMNGLIDDEVAEKVQKHEFGKIEAENQKLKDSLSIMEMTIKELVAKQEELELREDVRRKETVILSELNENEVKNTEEELLRFLKERKDIVLLLKEISSKLNC